MMSRIFGRSRFCLAFALLVTVRGFAADSFEINDGGRLRRFEIAEDERVSVRPKGTRQAAGVANEHDRLVL